MGKAGRTPLCRVAERDDALLDVAKYLFLERGFAQVSIESIARAAGVATRTIYTQFGGKHGVLCKIIDRELGRDIACSAELWDAQQGVDITLSTMAFNLLRHTLSPVARRLYADAMAARDVAVAEKIDPVHCGPWRRHLEQYFATVISAERFGPACEADVMSDMFLGCVIGAQSRALKASPASLFDEPALRAVAADVTRRFLTSVAILVPQCAIDQ
ncbi:TetR/AcrR family transcriptional regulator [Massilia sp. TW-1]|uniref:TetR/AcrR family transcriptional regulator n=1 Tax=Telluria antibiotica TaxID=2717319 RepID=A0ABX0P668_9BURK|nr:TetR/AcrR family transcriptional regulator [Telluria antibiotica]NIA52436.1 TetR/AcrR family transcriptional regulator [Telluria antibiotica]